MFAHKVFLLLALMCHVLAEINITFPTAGSSVPSLNLTVSFQYTPSPPLVSTMHTYQMSLCAGGNEATDYIQLALLVPSAYDARGGAAEAQLHADLGANIQNAYFIKVISEYANGKSITNFGPRFAITSMTGVFPASVMTGLMTVNGTKGPDNVYVEPKGAAESTTTTDMAKATNSSMVSMTSTGTPGPSQAITSPSTHIATQMVTSSEMQPHPSPAISSTASAPMSTSVLSTGVAERNGVGIGLNLKILLLAAAAVLQA